ncbi:MAG: class I SAM-dependent methyltransferase, partial [Actinomycetes bacterium]
MSAAWDAEAARFDQEPDHGLTEPETRNAWWRLLSGVLPQPPATVADLGSGTGSVSVLLAEHGYGVTGVDLSPRMVERATAKAAQHGVPVPFRVGDAARPDLPHGQFDVVFARHVVWALPDPVEALRNWVALLRRRGRLVLVEGVWFNGAGIGAENLSDLLRPLVAAVEVVPLPDPRLWGREILDDRYLLVATQVLD